MKKKKKILKFDFPEGEIISDKYEIIEKLGEGWEGEVYKIREVATGIERAAKFFLPERNKANKSAKFYANKLHKLRSCPILIQYLTQDTIVIEDHKITYLISDYVEGETLSSFLNSLKGKKMHPFQGLLLLHTLVKGLEDIHGLREYHGDLHTDNIIVQRFGLGFELKLLDMFYWGAPKSQDFKDDICDAVRILYDVLGGAKTYQKQPQEVKDICCGLKKSLILKKFKNLSQLRVHLETMSWRN
ncbi:MAG: serine/threonine protein kinase [Halobacteriovorax sp.]|nr:serine/threonine protein kinase [Halobacteriovorax sp.]|tara:strand:- start:24424 stop:25155 length:732 start_codon:yes stop_codon:yes gene_type:complete